LNFKDGGYTVYLNCNIVDCLNFNDGARNISILYMAVFLKMAESINFKVVEITSGGILNMAAMRYF
jgi:aminoglycoside phosphotransferase family enzyme